MPKPLPDQLANVEFVLSENPKTRSYASECASATAARFWRKSPAPADLTSSANPRNE